MTLEHNSENIHSTAGKVNVSRARECEISGKGMKKQHKNPRRGFSGVTQLNRIPIRLLQALVRMEVRAE